ncbi:hypothetical protein [Pseudomonas mercuritolerans]|uniref:Uncharacterized protein n=1 Tax=Pseudomonas mercuritolerans TaxID=2951809 RepID=A0ABT2XQ55_9PSED|nr:hypothetical protein [Pseudomonas mercuritolerans]MCV2220812.1 hypothetical protein [Pseudomonas mercuritolerans]
MSQSTQPDNTVLALAPPIVNGRTVPVEGAMIGLSIVAYDLVTDGEGAIVFADPPLSGTMDPNDVMELWLEAESAVLDSETIVDPDKRTTLRIPRGRLHPDRINELYYTVRRGSDNIGTSTTLTIHYNRIRPGLKDRYDAPGGHSELELLLPDVIKNGVGPDFVSAEVCVEYPYCRAHDVITLKCNGDFLEPKPRVLPTQAPLFPGSEAPIKICFTVTRAFLDKAKRQDKKLHFSYTVTDQIGNGPDTDAPWSPVQTVNEDLDGTLLPKLILLEREEDYPGDVAEIIDLEKLGNNNLLMVVLTKDPRIEVGDEIVATYTATDTGQPTDVVEVVRGNVEEKPFIGKLPCFLEVARNKVFAGSKVTATYEVHRPGVGLVGTSNTAAAVVIGTAPIELPPPTLIPATVPIEVLANPAGVKLQVTGFTPQTDDKAQFVQVNAPAGAPPFPVVDFVGGIAEILLSAAFLAAWHGMAIEFRWDLIRGGQLAEKSATATFDVMKIADEDPRLPTPKVPQATDEDILNLYDFPGDAQVKVAPWTGMQIGQKAELMGYGFEDDDSSHTIPLISNHTISEENLTYGLGASLPRNQLSKIKHDSILTLVFTADFAPNNNLINKTTFPKLPLTIQKLKMTSGLETWEQRSQQVFRQNIPVKLNNSFTVHVIRDSPNSKYYVQIYRTEAFPVGFGFATLLADHSSLFRLELDGVAKKMSVEFSAVHTYGTSIKFCGPTGEILYNDQIPVIINPQSYVSSYVAATGKFIAYVEILVGPEADGGVWIDNIFWE